MSTFWQILPFLIKLLVALVGTSGAVANAALTQVGAGAPATEWWKVLAWAIPGVAGSVLTVTHMHNSNKVALATAPPAGSNLEYLGRIAADCVQRADADTLTQVGQLSLKLKPRVVQQVVQ